MKFIDREGNEVPAPAHLLDDAPYIQCNICGRKSWAGENIGKPCAMPQPSGGVCKGRFEEPTL